MSKNDALTYCKTFTLDKRVLDPINLSNIKQSIKTFWTSYKQSIRHF